MIIIQTVDNATQMPGSGVCCTLGTTIIPTKPILQEIAAFCYCDFECEYEEKSFVNLLDTDKEDENDKTPLLVQVNDSGGSVQFFLVDESGEETEITDDTYGQFFPLGFVSSNNNKAGVIIEWHLVASSFGLGRYRIKTVIDSFGSESEIFSYWYSVRNYSEEAADGTIVFKTTHDGFIENGFDYRDLDWKGQFRVNGILNSFNPIPTITEYENGDRKNTQIQTRVEYEYNLQLIGIPEEIFKPLFRDYLLANFVFVSDYSLFNPNKKIRDLALSWVDVDNIEEFKMSRNVDVVIKMKEVDLGTVKRQF